MQDLHSTIYLPRARALNPSGRRQPVPDRTLGAQGRKARRRHQPSPAGRQPSGIQGSAVSLPKDPSYQMTHTAKKH